MRTAPIMSAAARITAREGLLSPNTMSPPSGRCGRSPARTQSHDSIRVASSELAQDLQRRNTGVAREGTLSDRLVLGVGRQDPVGEWVWRMAQNGRLLAVH